jgi:hypothetical protein
MNPPNIVNDLKELSISSGMICLTEKGDVMERAISYSIGEEKRLSPAYPTSDNGLVYFLTGLGTYEGLAGFFCGDPDEWIPVLLRDGQLSRLSGTWVAVFQLEFPPRTPYIKRNVEVEGYGSIMEYFVIYDKPIKPLKYDILVESELLKHEIKSERIKPIW